MLRCLKYYVAGRALAAGLDMVPEAYEDTTDADKDNSGVHHRTTLQEPTIATVGTRYAEVRRTGVKILVKGIAYIRELDMQTSELEKEMITAVKRYPTALGEFSLSVCLLAIDVTKTSYLEIDGTQMMIVILKGAPE